MKRILVFILIFQVCIPSFAQSKVVSGIITDKTGEPVPYVSVVLARDGAIVTGGMTDDNGRFQIKVDAGKYTLTAEFIGYSKETMQVEVKASRLDIGTIVLEESVQSLSGAVVSAKQEAKKSSVEHTTINADSNISGAKGSVLDILRTASSVSIASDKSITVRGKSNILVLIDGVPTTVTDLESIPAANVKSVDV
ncbi:MAG: carboxypeptidase-like regulatory domain-containing protein, partial [Bacteroidales bacterium]|nr:carboxypeptidase-like regulatory domain-containing protein [Candidatus Cacconaster caballi]